MAEIRDSKLYRQTHGTFEDYCQERWGWARRTAYQYIEAASVTENVRNCAQIPASESQARPLTKLEPEQQREAWDRANELAGEENKPVTAKHVQAAVAECTSTEMRHGVAFEEKEKIVIGVGMDCAAKAIDWLQDIPTKDPEFDRAFNHVINYCRERLGVSAGY